MHVSVFACACVCVSVWGGTPCLCGRKHHLVDSSTENRGQYKCTQVLVNRHKRGEDTPITCLSQLLREEEKDTDGDERRRGWRTFMTPWKCIKSIFPPYCEFGLTRLQLIFYNRSIIERIWWIYLGLISCYVGLPLWLKKNIKDLSLMFYFCKFHGLIHFLSIYDKPLSIFWIICFVN